MAARNRESVEDNWSLLSERVLTTGLCSEGWYSEHSGVCRRAELPGRSVIWRICSVPRNKGIMVKCIWTISRSSVQVVSQAERMGKRNRVDFKLGEPGHSAIVPISLADCGRGGPQNHTPSTLLQTLPDLVTPLKGHSLSPRSCPPTRSAPSERFGY